MGSFKVLYDYPNFASLPAVGEVSKLYITNDNNTLYRWVDGAYHFFTTTSVPWGNIDGVLTNQTDLMAVLNTKQGLITAGTTAQYYRGDKTFQTLNTAVVPESGNLYYSQARFDSAFGAKSTTDLAEGSKLFYTQGRFDSAFAAKSTSNLTEGSNLYYTDARFDTRLATKSTSNLAEGSNLYYTQGRFDSAFSAKKTDNLSEGITNFYYTSNRFNADFNSKNTDALPEGISNVYFTAARSRNALTLTTVGSGGAATYNSTTGVLNIPTYEDNLVDPLTGAGSAGYLGKYTGSTSIAPSLIYDNGVYVGINRTNPFYTLDVNGTLNVQGVSIYRNLAGTGSRLVYVDSTGTLTPAIIGSGLSMVSGTLSATGTASGSIGGSGTIDYIPKFSGTAAITNSNIQDSGSLITLGSNSYVTGSLGIGISPQANYGIRLSKTLTSSIDSTGISSEGQIQSDVTSTANLFNSVLSTQASTFTLTNFRHYRAVQGTIGSGSTITNQIGYLAESNLTGATNNYGFYGAIPSGTNRWNLYMNGTANNYMAGGLSIGQIDTNSSLVIAKNITGGTIRSSVLQYGQVLSDVTNTAYGFHNQLYTAAASFTLSNYTHYFTNQVSIGSGSTVTTQVGFQVSSNLTGATTNLGFQGSIPSGTNNWNLYMDGTAKNYLAGGLQIGPNTLNTQSIRVGKNITGATSISAIANDGAIQSDVTLEVNNYSSGLRTAASTFNLNNYRHYFATQTSIGSGSTVAIQNGFVADSTLTGATANYGFRGSIPSATNNWNLYMDGTAKNYLSGSLLIGSTTDVGYKLDVTGLTRFIGTTASDTAPLGSELAAVTGTGTNWTLAGTNLNVGGYTHTAGDVTPLTTTLAAVSGTYYQISITITSRTAGNVTINYGGISTGGYSSSNVITYLPISTSALTITPTSDFNGTIALSIKTIGTSSASSTFSNSSGTSNIEIRTSSDISNTLIGLGSGSRMTSGNFHTTLGYQALQNNTNGQSNTAIGYQSLRLNMSGSNNVAIGLWSLYNNTLGQQNTSVGQSSGYSNTTGINNTFIGTGAGYSNITGGYNIALGSQAGRYIADGSTSNTITNYSIFIGHGSKALADSQTNQIVIGANSTGLGSNTTVLGNSSITTTAIYGNLLLGTTSSNASALLQVDSTTQGVLFPRMTTTQKNAISSPAVGLIVYDTTLNKLCVYTGAWQTITSA